MAPSGEEIGVPAAYLSSATRVSSILLCIATLPLSSRAAVRLGHNSSSLMSLYLYALATLYILSGFVTAPGQN